MIISVQYAAYKARQQQLRIEKHRADSTFPLEEPAGIVRIFFRKYGPDIIFVLVNGLILLFVLTLRHPLGRWDVIMTAYLMSLTVAGLFHSSVLRLREKEIKLFSALIQADRDLFEMVKSLVVVGGDEVPKLLESIDKRISNVEKQL